MTMYRGDRTLDGVVVTADGRPLDCAFAVRKMSPLGFEWGYEGAAPAQLALALLFAESADSQTALAFHEAFMRETVANFANAWSVESAEIQEFLARRGMVRPS